MLGLMLAILAVAGCDVRKKGWMDKEEERQYGAMTIRWQVYPVRWWDEKSFVWWCRSPQTTSIKRDEKLYKRWRVKMNEDGWLHFGGTIVGYESSGWFGSVTIPWDRVQYIDDDFLYIDLGRSGQVITFDGCQTFDRIWDNGGHASPDRHSQRLILENEWQWLSYEKIYEIKISPPLFMGQSVENFDGNKRHCFNINPHHLAVKDKVYEICTEDQGDQWFTRIDGVERVADLAVSQSK